MLGKDHQPCDYIVGLVLCPVMDYADIRLCGVHRYRADLILHQTKTFNPLTQDQMSKDGEPVLITEMKFEDLIGKTIVSVKQKKLIGSDDEGFLEMQFSDGTKATIVAYYDGYEGEYPTGIFVAEQYHRDLEDVKQ